MRYGHFVMSIFCAWVLWSMAAQREGVVIETVAAYETYAECFKTMALGQQRVEEKGASTPIFGYQCLPDTVDPRAPKAGK